MLTRRHYVSGTFVFKLFAWVEKCHRFGDGDPEWETLRPDWRALYFPFKSTFSPSENDSPVRNV